MKKLIEDIMQRLVSTQTRSRYIDEDWGQLDYYSPSPPTKWPCILVDLGDAQWEGMGELIQTGRAQVIIRVASMRLSNTNVKAPQAQRDKAAEIHDLLTDIHVALHGWTGDSMNGPMTRQSTRRMKREDGIREFMLIYNVQVVDTSAKRVLDTRKVHGSEVDLTVTVAKGVRAADPPFSIPGP